LALKFGKKSKNLMNAIITSISVLPVVVLTLTGFLLVVLN